MREDKVIFAFSAEEKEVLKKQTKEELIKKIECEATDKTNLKNSNKELHEVAASLNQEISTLSQKIKEKSEYIEGMNKVLMNYEVKLNKFKQYTVEQTKAVNNII